MEHGGPTDGEVAEPRPDGSEDCVADGRGNNGRRRLAEADWRLCAVDELDIEFRHVADAQRRIAEGTWRTFFP